MKWLISKFLWFWRIASRPATHISLGVLALGGFLGGVIFWGGFNTALEVTNTEKFCTGCHEMRDNVYQELQRTPHFANRSGVRATCPDCHVPHNWTDKIARKMQASKEVWGKIFGTISTREKFLDMRLELAKHEWARLKANDSLECRNCHSAIAMDFTKQAPARRRSMPSSSSPASAPVSIATRASRMNCLTCPGSSPAGAPRPNFATAIATTRPMRIGCRAIWHR